MILSSVQPIMLIESRIWLQSDCFIRVLKDCCIWVSDFSIRVPFVKNQPIDITFQGLSIQNAVIVCSFYCSTFGGHITHLIL